MVLSQGDLLATIARLRADADISAGDRVFSALPVFHSFGLTGGLLPMTVGAHGVDHP